MAKPDKTKHYDCVDAINVGELPLEYQYVAAGLRAFNPNVYAKPWGNRWVFQTIDRFAVGTPEYGVREAQLFDLNYMLLIGKIDASSGNEMNIEQARKKLQSWPQPYKEYAFGNVLDAQLDLARWPELRKEILKDMTSAIKAWEVVMKGATMEATK